MHKIAQGEFAKMTSSAFQELEPGRQSLNQLFGKTVDVPRSKPKFEQRDNVIGGDFRPGQARSRKRNLVADVINYSRLHDLIRADVLKQRQIAEKAMRDPSVQKVTEKRDGAIQTVIVERRDGSLETYMPNGIKITSTTRFKMTEFPKNINLKVSCLREYPDGAVESVYRNGSTLFTPSRSEKSYRYAPDGTTTEIRKDGTSIVSLLDKTKITFKADGSKTTRKADGTEIVENANGDRTLTRADRVEADGTKVWHKDDGTEIRETSDGRRITRFPQKVNPIVQESVDFPSGDQVHVLRDGKLIQIRKDGTMTTVNLDGTVTVSH